MNRTTAETIWAVGKARTNQPGQPAVDLACRRSKARTNTVLAIDQGRPRDTLKHAT